MILIKNNSQLAKWLNLYLLIEHLNPMLSIKYHKKAKELWKLQRERERKGPEKKRSVTADLLVSLKKKKNYYFKCLLIKFTIEVCLEHWFPNNGLWPTGGSQEILFGSRFMSAVHTAEC